MVQVLPAVERRPSTAQRFSQAIGATLEKLPEIVGAYQQKKNEEQQYQQENETYRQLTGRNLSRNPKTRELEIEYALKGQGEFQKEEYKRKTKAEEAGIKLAGEQRTQKQLMAFADQLETNNPNSPVHKTIASIYRTELPMDQKSELVKSLTGVDPFKVQQQQRLQLDSVLKRYNSRLKELDDEIKNVANPNSTGKAEVNELKKQRMSLRSERDQLLDFKSLNGMEDEEEGFELKDEAELEDVAEEEEEEAPKIKFDPNNKGHRAAAEKLYKQYKDKEKVRQILRKRFKL